MIATPRAMRRAARVAAAALTAAGVPGGLAPWNTTGRPDVVVVQTDDQTVRDLRSMPQTRRLIEDRGVRFDDSIVSLSQCCPSRATFLTGRYAHNHGVLTTQPPWGGAPAFHPQESLAVWLQRSGYVTALVGKYLNGFGAEDPTAVPPGWTEWHGLVAPTFYRYFDFLLNDSGHVTRHTTLYQTDVLTQRAVSVIRRRAAGPRPLFLYVAYVAPHQGEPADLTSPLGFPSPIASPLFDRLWGGTPLPHPPAFNEADVSDKPANVADRPRIRGGTLAAMTAAWQRRQEALQSVDAGVVRIVRALKQVKALRDTLLIFTSDNGYMTGQHRLPSGKLVAYEPSLQVPLLVRGPGVPRGRTSHALVWNGDLAPTILQAARAHAPWVPDGESLWPLLRHPARDPARSVLLEGPPAGPRSAAPRFAGVHTRRYAYLEHDTGERELYDLRRDPAELRNLALTSPPVEHELHVRLARLRHCAGVSCHR